jgi:hypothetical protein
MSLIWSVSHWLYETPFATAVRESDWAFSMVETVHVLGLALMVGTVAVVDFRLLGLVFRRQPASQVMAQVLPLTWAGFVVMAASGLVLFVASAEKLLHWVFGAKVALLIVAGLNPLIFHSVVHRGISGWDEGGASPVQAKAAALLSLLLWSAIIVLGRLVAYVE